MVLASPGSLSKLSSSVRQNTPSRPVHMWWGVYHVWWGSISRVVGDISQGQAYRDQWQCSDLAASQTIYHTLHTHNHEHACTHIRTCKTFTNSSQAHTCTNPHAHTRTCLYGIEWDIDDEIVDTGLGRADLEPQKDREWELHSVNAKKNSFCIFSLAVCKTW